MCAYVSHISFVWSLGKLPLFRLVPWVDWIVSILVMFIFSACFVLYLHFLWCNQMEIFQLLYIGHGLSVLALLTVWAGRLACDCRLLSSIHGLYPLGASSSPSPHTWFWQPKMSLDVDKHLLKSEVAPGWNHCCQEYLQVWPSRT